MEENAIPSTEDIKDYIREELEKHISTQQLSLPSNNLTDSLSRDIVEDYHSESMIQVNETESNISLTEGMFGLFDKLASGSPIPDTSLKSKPKKVSKVQNPFAVSKPKKAVSNSNGKSLLSAIATKTKTEGAIMFIII